MVKRLGVVGACGASLVVGFVLGQAKQPESTNALASARGAPHTTGLSAQIASAARVTPASRSIPADSTAQLAEAQVELEHLRQERTRLEGALQQALENARPQTLSERLLQAGALPQSERRSAGWKLWDRFGDELDEAGLLAILRDERDPGVLEVVLGMLHAGATSCWKGAELELVLGACEDPAPQLRQCAGLLVASRCARAYRDADRAGKQAFTDGTPSDPAVARMQRALCAGWSNGDDALLESAADRLGDSRSYLWTAARVALHAGASAARTHAGRVAAFYALGREPGGGGSELLLLLHGDNPSPTARPALAEAVAAIWSSSSQPDRFPEITPGFHDLHRGLRDTKVRRKLVEAWAEEGLYGHDEALVRELRVAAAREPDANLRATMLRLAEQVEAGEIMSSVRVGEILRGQE